MSIFLLENREKFSIKELASILGFKSRTSIINRIKNLSIPPKGNRKGDVSPLLEESLISFYWMGFILADGHFTKSNQLVVSLSLKDKDHLEKLSKFLNCKVKIYKRSICNGSFKGSQKEFCRIAIQDFEICQKLKVKFDVKNNKTYCPPNLASLNFTDDQFLALIVGFVDGDGSFTNLNSIKIECHSSWRENFIFFSKLSERIFNRKLNVSDETRKYVYTYIPKEVVLQLRQFSVSNKLPFLVRKWLK